MRITTESGATEDFPEKTLNKKGEKRKNSGQRRREIMDKREEKGREKA